MDREHPGRRLRTTARQAAELADTGSKTDQVDDELGEDFLPGLAWFATGLVAEYGQGDLTTLRGGPPPSHP